MPQYRCLLYADPSDDPVELDAREAERPLWVDLHASLQEAGVLVSTGRLRPPHTATTLHGHGDDVDVVDGPFAITKEILAGYYVVECADLDDALGHARRIPLVRYGSVEVRPLDEEAGGQ